jgi:competence protein ComEC
MFVPTFSRALAPAVVAAALSLHLSAELPSPAALVAAAITAAVAAIAGAGLARAAHRVESPRLACCCRTLAAAMPIVAVTLLAWSWSGWTAQQRLERRLAPADEGQDLVLVGVVDELPTRQQRGRTFRFRVEHCDRLPPAHGARGDGAEPPVEAAPGADRAGGCRVPPRIQLGWHSGFTADSFAAVPELLPAQRWQLTVRLRRPHALVNPHAFDRELRWLHEDIGAVGTVRRGTLLERRVPGIGLAAERTRSTIRDAMLAVSPRTHDREAGVLVALAIGDQASIEPALWALFNQTGVGHLMSISGLHITMLAGLGGVAAGWLWRRPLAGRLRLAERVSAPVARLATAVVVAFCYAMLAGWGIPAQRTCWMLAVAALLIATGRDASIWTAVGLAAAAIVAMDPWAPLTPGFWLSFGAVLAIVWVCAGDHYREPAARRFVRAAVQTQWAATVSLIPMGVWFFGAVSVVGPLANAIAIPVVSVVITPIALAGGALAPALPVPAAWLLWAAALVLSWLLAGLEWLAALPLATVPIARPTAAVLVLAALGCAWLLAPAGTPARVAGLAALLPLAFTPLSRPGAGELWLTALDVGQGNAVLVETEGRALVYDTGPPFGPASDAGSRIIVPYLRARGITRLDAVVVSHADADHVGGAQSLLRALPHDLLASSLPDGHPVVAAATRHVRCRRGESWRWGATRFSWLHPAADPEPARRSGANALSCVLRIEGPAGTVLLAGDIEAPQERRLLESVPAAALRSDVLLAPHHGSLTSSTEAFLDAVAPSLAIFQVGYRSRYNHPHPTVLARYRQRDIGVLRSDFDGAVQIRLRPGAAPVASRARADPSRYWRVDAAATVPSIRRPSPRRRRGPGPPPASTGSPPARRADRVSRMPATAASRRAATCWRRQPTCHAPRPSRRSASAPATSAPSPGRSRCR